MAQPPKMTLATCKYNSKSPKAYYLRGLINYSLENIEIACEDLKFAFDEGLISEINLYQIACLQN